MHLQTNLPRVLGELVSHDSKVLEERNILLQFPNLNPNSKELKKYKKILPNLSETQFHWCVGLLLGDASITVNSNLQSYRIKIQQSEKNCSLLYATEEIMKPFVLNGVSDLNVRKQKTKYRELQTLSCPQLTSLAKVFTASEALIKPNSTIHKSIPHNIANYLSPVAIGAWFCSDGGKRDYGPNQGKAIQFHTQGFSKQNCETLALALRSKYGWNVIVKLDYDDKYYIQVEADSFDSFLKYVYPYILDHFCEKLPKPRVKNRKLPELSKANPFLNFFVRVQNDN